MKPQLAAFTLLGLASATTDNRDPRCGAIGKCFLVDLEHDKNGNNEGTEIPQDAATALPFDPAASSLGWTIKCKLVEEMEKSEDNMIDYVQYYFGDDEVNTHYSEPFYLNEDGSAAGTGTRFKFEDLTDKSTCGAIDIAVQGFMWDGGREIPCDTTVLKLNGPPCPTSEPTPAPPTKAPTDVPTKAPSLRPTSAPTKTPTSAPTSAPTKTPTSAPTPAPKCASITKCSLVNLDTNKGVTLTKNGDAADYWPKGSQAGYAIKCEKSNDGELASITYTNGQSVYTVNDSAVIPQFESLSENQCDGNAVSIQVTSSLSNGATCEEFTLNLQPATLPPSFYRCHLCRKCKSMRFHTTGPFPIPFQAKAQLQVVQRGGLVSVSTELPEIRYRPGRDYVDAYWLDYPNKVAEVADGSVFMRGENECGAAPWRKCSVGSPIALDLDRSGAVEHITGKFDFDLSGNGIPEELTEWFAPTEGILVDSTYPGFASGNLIGWHLYGDLGGLHDDGFDKLALHDFNGDGIVSGADELEGIGVWTDTNSNAKLDEGELSTLEDHNVVSLYLSHDEEYISKAIVDTGDEQYEVMTQDLWFARR